MIDHTHEDSFTPAQWLMENVALLPKGRVLDVAMGNGRNAIYLAQLGFSVEGVDASPEAIENAAEAAREAGVTIKAQVANLESEYQIKPGLYDVQRSLIPQIKTGLKKGGLVVYETFIVDQVRFGKPRNPDYLLKHNELLDLFRDFRCLRYREGVMAGQKAVAGIIAEKV
jgi:tellurite methyltransferase